MVKYRGYEALNPSIVLPAIVDLATHYPADVFAEGRVVARAVCESPVLTGCIDWLAT